MDDLKSNSGKYSRLLFILVNFYNEKQTVNYIRNELFTQSDKNIHIVIINNGSIDKAILSDLENEHDNVCLFSPEKNLGYFGAAQYGFEHFLKVNSTSYLAVIISNTDIRFKDNDFIEKLRLQINDHCFDILGPDIISTFLHRKQNPYIAKRIEVSKLKMLKFLSSGYYLYNLFLICYFLKAKLVSVFKSAKDENRTTMNVYAVHGSFIVFAKSYFDKGGNFNYPSFLFGEEIFVAEKARQLDLKIIYEPSLQLSHDEHSTTGIFKSRKIIKFLNESYQYLLKEFFT